MHTLKLEKIIDSHEYGYPTVIEAERNCPPEDVGGTIGYEHFLQVLANPDDSEHESLKEWEKSMGTYCIEKTNE